MSSFLDIQSDPKAFITAIQEGKTVCGNKKGQWYIEGKFKTFERTIKGTDDARLAKIGLAYNACLDQLESTPVTFGTAHQKLQMKKYSLFLNIGAVVRELLDEKKENSEKIQEQLNKLDIRLAGLNYRLEGVNGGLDRVERTFYKDTSFLENLAVEWKKGKELFIIKELGRNEKNKLERACQHPEFFNLLKKDATLRNEFFTWIMIQNNDPETFIQFPAKARMMDPYRVGNRIGRFEGQNCLTIEKRNKNSSGQKKILTLPFEIQEDSNLTIKRVSILKDSKKVALRGNYEQTIKEIFDQIKVKKYHSSNVEFINGVIRNFNTFKFGWWNPEKIVDGSITPGYETVDFSQENSEFWNEMPPFEIISKKTCMERYGIDKLEDGQWVMVATSTRESDSLDVLKAHGYDIYAIPDADGNYKIFPLGRFAVDEFWPVGMVEQFLFLADTVPATYSYDENEFYPHRQKAYAPYVLTPEQGKRIMEAKRKNIVEALKGQKVFQFSSENCANETQVLLENELGKLSEGGRVPNMFKTHILNTEARIYPMNLIFKFSAEIPQKVKEMTKGFHKPIRKFFKNMGMNLQNLVIRIVEFISFSWRGMYVIENGQQVWKSTSCSSFREDNSVFLPSLLHSKIKNGLIHGRIAFGQNVVQL